jgi:hypothetical protein
MDNIATEFRSPPTTLNQETSEDPAKTLLQEFDISKLSDKPKKQQSQSTSTKRSSEPPNLQPSTQNFYSDAFDHNDDVETISNNSAHNSNQKSESDSNDALPMKNKTEQRLFELQLRLNKARQEAKLAIQEEAKFLNELGQPIFPLLSGPTPPQNQKNKKRVSPETELNDNKEEKPEHGMDPDRYYRLHQTIETLDKKEKARKRKRQTNNEFDGIKKYINHLTCSLSLSLSLSLLLY